MHVLLVSSQQEELRAGSSVTLSSFAAGVADADKLGDRLGFGSRHRTQVRVADRNVASCVEQRR